MSYKILIDDKVLKDLKKIDPIWRKRILGKIKNILATHPYSGKKLVSQLSPFQRLGVENYHVIYSIEEETVTVEVIRIRRCKDIYLSHRGHAWKCK